MIVNLYLWSWCVFVSPRRTVLIYCLQITMKIYRLDLWMHMKIAMFLIFTVEWRMRIGEATVCSEMCTGAIQDNAMPGEQTVQKMHHGISPTSVTPFHDSDLQNRRSGCNYRKIFLFRQSHIRLLLQTYSVNLTVQICCRCTWASGSRHTFACWLVFLLENEIKNHLLCMVSRRLMFCHKWLCERSSHITCLSRQLNMFWSTCCQSQLQRHKYIPNGLVRLHHEDESSECCVEVREPAENCEPTDEEGQLGGSLLD